MKVETIFNQEYNWEDSYDFERDLHEALEDVVDGHGGEWPGTVKVTIEYIPEEK